MTRRDYFQVAGIIARMPASHRESNATIALWFARNFKALNPLFNEQKFFAACIDQVEEADGHGS